MTLRKLQLQARYNVLTPAALIGVSGALLFGALPAFAAAQTNSGNVTSVQIGAGNAFTNTGHITSDGTHAAVYSTTDIESIFNAAGATIVGDPHAGIFIDGNVNGAVVNNGTVSSTSSYGIEIIGSAGSVNNAGAINSYDTGIYIDGGVNGSFTNSASISASTEAGVAIYGDIAGNFANSSTISGTWAGVYVDGSVANFTNSGSISGSDGFGVEILGDVGSFTNSNAISSMYGYNAAGVYISGGAAGGFTNSGSISQSHAGNTGYGVHINGDADSFTNTSMISANSDRYGYGVFLNGDVNNFTNSGMISTAHDSRAGYAVYISGDVQNSFTNSGTISASYVSGSNHATGVYISGDVQSFTNTASGKISSINSYNGDGVYIVGQVGQFANAGSISSSDHYNGHGLYIGNGVGTFTNSGAISVSDSYFAYGAELYGQVGSFTNSNAISAAGYDAYGAYLSGTIGNFNNSGSISAAGTGHYAYGLYVGGTVGSVNNSGTISATDPRYAYGVYLGGNVNSFTNSGSISGTGHTQGYGVYVNGTVGSFTNSGSIGGSTGAIYFGDANSTLRILTGASFGGGVYWNNNAGSLFDFSGFHGNMIFEEYGSLPTGHVLPGDNLYLQTSHQVIIVGDASVTNSSQPVSDVTDGISNLLNSELDFGGAGGGGGGGGGPLGYAPVRVNSAAVMATAKAMAPKVTDGPVWWASGTGGGSNNGVDASDVFGALVFGAHTQVQDGLEAGALGAYAHSIARTDSSQTITSDSGIIGAYGRAELQTVSLDFSILAGASTNASSRTVSTPGGPETATATFGGWFINPRVGVSMPVLSSDKGDLSVTGTVGYLFGGFGGYTETGSSANMTVGAQTIGLLDAAVGLKGKKELGPNEHGVVVGKGSVEAFAQSNIGTSSVPITVLGTTIGNALPPSALVLGVRAGLGLEVPLSDNVTFSASGNTSIRTDFSISGAATVKVSGTF